MLKIPKSFKLFNQTIKVIYKTNLLDKEHAFGVWAYNKNTIYLQKSTRKHKLTNEQIYQTVCHELIHACLDLLGYHKLSDDEKLVSGLSNLLDQFMQQLEWKN